jgi:nucleoside-diphosphate-sugar epimerase
VLDQYKPEIVVHLAAIVDAFMTNREGKDVECNIVNNTAAVQVAKLCKEYGTHTFIFQSTVSLYSRGENITEDSPKEPISAYGRSKLDAEDAIFALGDAQFKVCALRSATIVGYNPSFRYETIVNMLCIRSLYGIETNIFESALTSPKSYLTLEDEAAGIIFAIENIERLQGNSYNLSSFNTDLQEVIRLIEQSGTKPLFRISKEKTINQQVYTISAEKIRDLGFVPQGDIKSVIAQTQKGLITRKDLLENSQI